MSHTQGPSIELAASASRLQFVARESERQLGVGLTFTRSPTAEVCGRKGVRLRLISELALALSAVVVQAMGPPGATFYIFGYGSLLNTASTDKTNCGLSGFAEGDLGGLLSLFQKMAA